MSDGAASPVVRVGLMDPHEITEVARLYRDVFGPMAGSCSDEENERLLREDLDRPYARTWVARGDEGEIRGFLMAWHIADEVSVHQVATRAEWRRQGVGAALMLEVLRHVQEHQGRYLLLEVRRSNMAARRLYRALGMHVSALRRRYYADGEDALEMALEWDGATGRAVSHDDEVAMDDEGPIGNRNA